MLKKGSSFYIVLFFILIYGFDGLGDFITEDLRLFYRQFMFR